ncbi:cytochrome P450 [Colletotrichum scovillei]|uniref:Cytochrome P450 n=1 Tax=Colletotrichum scovillei TaxID=1209932 RepID=A0A9P7QSU0_9PEZI|nr:cytochrome P450 [Colletotrichum scovillei]KAG7040473.1 cytochrome P450 [Colletotrichum scovillei]KAG7060521.1 cytochrome P450 [Colletotrichum scovillei]
MPSSSKRNTCFGLVMSLATSQVLPRTRNSPRSLDYLETRFGIRHCLDDLINGYRSQEESFLGISLPNFGSRIRSLSSRLAAMSKPSHIKDGFLGSYAEWLVLGLLFLVFLRSIVKFIDEERRIRRHGGHASRYKSYTPFGVLSGLHFLWSITTHALQDQNLKFMHNAFLRSGQGKKNPYTFEVSLIGTRAIFTADPENIRAMLATQFNDFGKGQRFRADWFELMGNSIFNVDGDAWHASRQRLRSLFTRQRVSDLVCFERHIQDMLPALAGGHCVDMKDVLSRLALDVSADFSLGRQVNSLTSEDDDAVFEAFERIRHTQSLIERLGPLNFLVPRRKFRKDLEALDKFMGPSIEKAISMSDAELTEMDKTDHGWTLLHACAGVSRDARYLRDEMSMTFVTHVLNETLRLYPNAPFNIRAASKDTSLPRGGGPGGNDPVGVPSGTQIIYSTHVLQLRDDLNSYKIPLHDFYPRRWETWTPRPWTYIPFNGGPRICIGQQLALTEMAYDSESMAIGWEKRGMEPDSVEKFVRSRPRMASEITLAPRGGVDLVFRE